MIRNSTSFLASFVALTLAGAVQAGLVETRTNGVANGSITIDGSVVDWAGVTPYSLDLSGDGGTGYDLSQLWIANDDNNYYVRVQLHGEGSAVLPDGAGMWTWFDTDKNPATGLGAPTVKSGLGVEWNGSGLSQFNGWNAAGGFTGSILGSTVIGARNATHTEYEYSIPRAVFGVNSFHASAQSEFGDGDTTPDGGGNYFGYVASNEGPPPPASAYHYVTTGAIGPQAGGPLSDVSLTKLTDGRADRTDWLDATDPQWVGFHDATEPVPGGDNEQSQPRIEFKFDTPRALESVEITYMVDTSAQVHAPDEVHISFSNGGGPFAGEIAGAGFDNSDDMGTGTNGAIRVLTLPLNGIQADAVRLDFINNWEWTFLGEIKFNVVPEPSSITLGLVGMLGLVVGAARQRSKIVSR